VCGHHTPTQRSRTYDGAHLQACTGNILAFGTLFIIGDHMAAWRVTNTHPLLQTSMVQRILLEQIETTAVGGSSVFAAVCDGLHQPCLESCF
jgi:hypothetical protein